MKPYIYSLLALLLILAIIVAVVLWSPKPQHVVVPLSLIPTATVPPIIYDVPTAGHDKG